MQQRRRRNTLSDLYGVEPQLAAGLPDEVFGEGDLNSLSPLQSEQFLNVANQVLEQVLADEALKRRLFDCARVPLDRPIGTATKQLKETKA